MKKYGDVRRIIPAGSLGQCTYIGTWKDDVKFKCFDCNTKISFNPFGFYIKNLEPDWLVKIDCPICKANKKMIKQAMLVDIYDAPRDTVVQAFIDSVELNGNPFYHRWRVDNINKWDEKELAKRKSIVDVWLKEQGLTKDDTIIITGGW